MSQILGSLKILVHSVWGNGYTSRAAYCEYILSYLRIALKLPSFNAQAMSSKFVSSAIQVSCSAFLLSPYKSTLSYPVAVLLMLLRGTVLAYHFIIMPLVLLVDATQDFLLSLWIFTVVCFSVFLSLHLFRKLALSISFIQI